MSQIVAAIVTVALLICSPFVSAEDRRADKDHLVIMTLNAEWMWDAVPPEDGNILKDREKRKSLPDWVRSQPKAEAHMQAIAQLIKSANPDVVNLVEVEDLQALKTLNQKFLSDMGYQAYLVVGKDTETGQDVGLLTRIDPVSDSIFRDERKGESGNVKSGVSKHYIAEMEVNGTKIALIGIHLISKRKEANNIQREAQADAVRQMSLKELQKGYVPIILGDFNEYDGEVRDHIDSEPPSKTLAIAKSMDPGTNDDDLKSVAEKIEKPKRYTHWWDKNDNKTVDPGELTSLDHILLPVVIFDRITEARILQEHDPLAVSDHFPIVIRVGLKSSQ